jgi:sigma-B regulation protein RsbU (phosphoserine phosphatase)
MNILGQRIPLRMLLVVPFVLQLLGTVGLISYLSFRNGQRAVNDLAAQLRNEVTARVSQQLENYMAVPFQINAVVADSYARSGIDLSDLSSSFIFWQQATIFDTTNLVYCGNDSDGAFMGVGRENDRDDRVLELQYSGPSTDYLFHYHDLDQRGNVGDLRTVDERRPYEPRLRPWYLAAQSARQETWSDIYVDFDTRLPVITASNPVYDESGSLLGVCATDFLLSVELDMFLSGLQVGKTGQVFIIERDGTLVSSSTSDDEVLVLEDQNDEVYRLKMTDSQNTLVSGTGLFLMETLGDLASLQAPRQLQFDFQDYTPLNPIDDRQLVQVSPFSDPRGIDWLIVVVVPEADFMGQIHAQNRNTAVLSLAAVAIATGIGFWTARWISKPISSLTSASQALATDAQRYFEGDRPHQRVAVRGIAELETLSASFNQMASQLQQSFQDLETVNAELEQRVEQRTYQLRQANDEITHLNRQLKAENRRMSTELDVARQMQQMILPRAVELQTIPHLDIAGFMEAATELGGDYYDVIHQGDRTIIGIGDVTGHGLESSMVMLMVQAAVRALLAEAVPNPVRFLNALNQMVYQNAQRISPGKNLTLVMLDYDHGKLTVYGQHEEVLVVRASGLVERVDTLDLGYPLGIVDDISAFVAEAHLALAPGDGVVLYTDGITEAEGGDRQLYGIERLMMTIKHAWHLPATEVIQAIVEDVQQHVQQHPIHDDLTLIVLKRQAH